MKKSKLVLILLLVVVAIAAIALVISMKFTGQKHSEPVSHHQTTTTKKVKTGTSHKDDQIGEVKQMIAADLKGMSGDTSAYYYNLKTDKSYQYGTDQTQRAASDIKLFILAAAYQEVADGKLDLSSTYTLQATDKVGGSGSLQQIEPGTQISYQDLIKAMITQSDNTASNIIVKKLGGISAVNQEIKHLCMKDTKMQRMLMDTDKLKQGQDNMTSAHDIGLFLTKLYRHQIISKTYDDAMLKVLSENTNHTKLPQKVDPSITTYNKSGEFDDYGVENDAAIFEKGDKAFVIVVLSQNGQLTQQIPAMNKLGADLTKLVLED